MLGGGTSAGKRGQSVKLRTNVKAGGIWSNANEAIVTGSKSGLKVKTRVKAGGAGLQHNQTVLATPSRKASAKARAKKRV